MRYSRFNCVYLAALMALGCAHGPSQHGTSEEFDLVDIKSKYFSNKALKIEHPIYFFPGPTSDAPAVLILHELPGLSSNTLAFAKALSEDFNIYVPQLFGHPNQANSTLGMLAFMFNGEWREKTELRGSRPITQWLSGVVEYINDLHPQHPMGVIGMCLSGAMPLALLNHNGIKAIVLAQPSLPFFGRDDDVGISETEWEFAKHRAALGDIHVYGVRFQKDSISKRAKYLRLKRELGERAFLDREISVQEYCKQDFRGKYTLCSGAHSSFFEGWASDSSNSDPVNIRRREAREFLKQWLKPT